MKKALELTGFILGALITIIGVLTMYYSVRVINQSLLLTGLAAVGIGPCIMILIIDLADKITTKKAKLENKEKSYTTWYATQAQTQLLIHGVAEIPCKTLLTVRSKYDSKHNKYYYTITSDYILMEHGDANNTNEIINNLKKYI